MPVGALGSLRRWLRSLLHAGIALVRVAMMSFNFPNLHNPSSLTIVLNFTQPLTEITKSKANPETGRGGL
jgi:hypothetical protein